MFRCFRIDLMCFDVASYSMNGLFRQCFRELLGFVDHLCVILEVFEEDFQGKTYSKNNKFSSGPETRKSNSYTIYIWHQKGNFWKRQDDPFSQDWSLKISFSHWKELLETMDAHYIMYNTPCWTCIIIPTSRVHLCCFKTFHAVSTWMANLYFNDAIAWSFG